MEETKANVNWLEQKVCKESLKEEIRKYSINSKTRNDDFGKCVNQIICSLAHINISFSTSEKNWQIKF